MRSTLRSFIRALVLLALMIALGVGAFFRGLIRLIVRPLVVFILMISLGPGAWLRARRQRRAYRLQGIEILPAESIPESIPHAAPPPKTSRLHTSAPYVAIPEFSIPNLRDALRAKAPWLTRRYALGLLAFAVAIGVIAYNAPPPFAYHRYVSPPFADGTRYTFLYPSGWRMFQAVSSVESGVTFRKRLNAWENFRRWVGLPARVPEGSVTVYEIKVDPKALKIGRVDADGAYKDRLEHDVQIAYAPTSCVYMLTHRGTINRQDDFLATDFTIAQSFKLLPQGAKP